MITPTIDQLLKVLKAKNYPIFDDGKDYNINTIGIRSTVHDESGEKVTNKFNDLLCIFYKVGGVWQLFTYNCTTEPGDDYFAKPINKEFGTAIMVPGFYKGAYQLGLHFGKPALQQIGNLSLYRDSNKDLIIDLDPKTIQTINWSAINIHYSMDNVQNVDNWSAGCQVLAYGPTSNKYQEFLSHYRAAIKIGWKNNFSYGLVLEKDFV